MLGVLKNVLDRIDHRLHRQTNDCEWDQNSQKDGKDHADVDFHHADGDGRWSRGLLQRRCPVVVVELH